MMSDIRRICERPEPEDREWFPDIAGSDWVKTLDFAMRNYRDESFIAQFLSSRPIREIFIEVLAKRPMPLTPKPDGRITVLNKTSREQSQ